MVFFHLIKANSIEGVDEGGVGLAIDLGERDGLEIQVLHGVGIKEEFAAVMGGKKFTFFLLGDNRCDLREVADENDLDSPEWLVFVGPKAAQGLVDIIEHVGANHRDFIDDKGLECAHGLGVTCKVIFALHIFEGDIDSKGEEVMDGDTADVDGGYTRGSADCGVLIENVFAQVGQDGGFAGAGVTCEKEGFTGLG